MSSQLITVATRHTEFPFRAASQPYTERKRRKWRDDPGGEGPQIVRELRVCAPCATVRSSRGRGPVLRA
ncbi:hypothetical protein JY651_35045 [Pyxidicoccus parkwayensis]|uniref:Uncharacterized protein n=1 Tax=Pyxidicoccus parkwayensis TaxID=2813578 RepID=A0ABX7NPS8_9BACT|nr:hypothetical protein [Pyxidicoccus parkwaysis]QSQ20436.1 hypothetical protein JY651_35045 [Pyxidicoccus parkwaysis]